MPDKAAWFSSIMSGELQQIAKNFKDTWEAFASMPDRLQTFSC